MIRAIVFDLDGVLRHFDSKSIDEIEQRHNLAHGAIHSTAFSTPLLGMVTTGAITRREWVEQVGEQLGNRQAAVEWSKLRPSVDGEVLELVDELRASDCATAILTNGTDEVPYELHSQGIAPHFDHVFNSAEIGVAKPEPEVFDFVLRVLDLPANSVFFTDDSASKLTGAHTRGIHTHHFRDIAGLRRALRDVNVI